ncbi:MAG: RNA pyrophosphohydrolase [Proteobacteria bacterium]|nr:RNA pyrophosphohydrolase [Pseudomonadota bacterium]
MSIDPNSLPYRPCVGLMVLNGRNEVWIGQRINRAGKDAVGGWWQMPQGGIDEGEEPATAALRELSEETGMRSAKIIAESRHWYPYDLPPELKGRIWGGRYRGQTQKWFALRFTGPESEIDLAPPGHEPEFDQWRWAPLDDVLALIVPFKRDVYRRVIDEFRPIIFPEKTS